MRYRDDLPQLGGDLFLTDGGLETVLIFHEGVELPAFAAFALLDDAEGTERLRRYYAPYLALARDCGAGFVLESPTWRASPRWAAELGYDDARLDALNRAAIALLEEVRADTITRAATAAGLPVAISFTLETDGRLPSGQGLDAAIEQVDRETGRGPSYYMINCAHPTHFDDVLGDDDGAWRERIGGLRANASTRSHQELDEAEELDAGDPDDLGARYVELRGRLPRLNVLGGCCGTDHRHVAAIRDAWLAGAPRG